MNRWLLFLAVPLVCLQPLYAAKVYKWTDEEGNVSYRDKPPPKGGGTVEEKEIDPNRNVIESSRLKVDKPGVDRRGADIGHDGLPLPSQDGAPGQVPGAAIGGTEPPADRPLGPSGTPPVTPPTAPTPLPELTLPQAPTPPPPAGGGGV